MIERVIATDTAASVTKEIAEKEGIALIPLYLIWPDGHQDTNFTISAQQFYIDMEKYGIPTTSAANPKEFASFYNDLYLKGAREVVSVHVTDKKSGTFRNALLGASDSQEQHPDLNILVINTKGFSLAQWFYVLEVKETLKLGFTLQEIQGRFEDNNPALKLYAAIDSLANLDKSGRIGHFEALAGSLLSYKPIIELTEDGDLVSSEKVRTRRKSWDRIVEKFRDDIKEIGSIPKRVGVIYTQDEEVGNQLSLKIKDIWESGKVEFIGPCEAGPILGVHSGGGAGGIAAQW